MLSRSVIAGNAIATVGSQSSYNIANSTHFNFISIFTAIIQTEQTSARRLVFIYYLTCCYIGIVNKIFLIYLTVGLKLS